MKTWPQIAGSTSLLLFGSVVVLFSLQMAHTRSSLAASLQSLHHQKPSPTQKALLFDSRLPGTLPYIMERGRDRLTLAMDEPVEKTRHLLEFSQERDQAALLVFQQGDESTALTTATKAFGYYQSALLTCDQESISCPELKANFDTTHDQLFQILTVLQEQAQNADIRAKAEGQLSALASLPEPFNF